MSSGRQSLQLVPVLPGELVKPWAPGLAGRVPKSNRYRHNPEVLKSESKTGRLQAGRLSKGYGW